ncbi:hypothetical protein YPPY88_0162, partial [Yersinia pestis PY-88]
MRLPA